MPPEQLVRRHLAVRRRLLAAETERDDLSANLRRLAGVHEKLEGELREAGGVGDEDAKDAQGELDDHAFATIDVDKESLIERHLLAISKLTATEAECASLAATAEGVEEKNCELRAEIRRRKYARLGGESVRIDVGRVAQGMGDDDDDDDDDADDDARLRADATRNASPPARPSSPPLIIRAAEESGMPFTLADAMAPCDEARVVVNEDGGTVVHVNAAWERLCGYSAEECVGVDLKELIECPDSEEALFKALVTAVKQQGACAEARLTGYRKDGSEFVARLRVGPLYCERTNERSYLGVMTLSRSTHNSDDDLPTAAEKNSPPPRTASLSPPLPVRQENGKVYVGGDPNCLAPPLKRKLSPPTPENEEIDGIAKTHSDGHDNGAENGLAMNERLTRSTRDRSGGRRGQHV
jgi:PAS domain S-box-containing protein